jgi:hypothetical protein
MDSSTTAIVAGASAAILASVLTGWTTFRATRETLKYNSSALATQLRGEREGAREDREQDRRKETYVSLLKYVFWLSNVNQINRRVVARQHSAVAKLRPDGRPPKTAEAAGAERAAFVDAGPTEEEQLRVDGGPTSEDNAATYALVTALSSDKVLRAFEELMDCDRAFASKQVGVAVALLREPKPTAVEPRVADTSDVEQITPVEDARQVIDAAVRLSEAIKQMIDAGKDFDDAVKKISKLVRDELKET